jgi:ABC-type Fe3+ transport system permease subunit
VKLTAAGLWVGLLLSTLLAVLSITAAGRLFAEFADAPQQSPWVWRLARLRPVAVIVMAAIVFLIAVVPLGNLFYKAGVEVTITDAGRLRSWSLVKALIEMAQAPMEFRSELMLTGRVGALAATGALLAAVPLAWSMRRPRQAPVVRLALLATCLTIPGPLLGLGVIRALNQPAESVLGFLGRLYDSNFAPWLVQTVRAVPLATLILWPALASVPQSMLDTAATDGSGWLRRLLWIALPQRWPAVAAAWLVGFAVAVGELGATVLVQPPGEQAISVSIFQLLHYGVDDRAAAICLVMLAGVAALTAIAAALLMRKSAMHS